MRSFLSILALSLTLPPAFSKADPAPGECKFDSSIVSRIDESDMKEAIVASAKSRCLKMNEDIRAGKFGSESCQKSGTLQVNSKKYQACIWVGDAKASDSKEEN